MELRRLPWTTTGLIDDDFRSGDRAKIILPEQPEPIVRVVDGTHVPIETDRFIDLFTELDERESEGDYEPATDRWLAPRVHAALRLTRLEAADPRIWNYLSVVAVPEYVRRRFRNRDKRGNLTTTIDRFVGRDRRKQAIARLWWGAEMLRNGPSYEPVVQAFTMQDIPNGLIGYTCFENRPLAIALVDELSKLNNGAPATSDQVQLVGRRINLWLATTALDVIAPDYNSDPDRVWAFVTERQPAPILADELPLGPDDGEVDHGSLEAARTLARRIIGLDMQTEQEAS